jgi:pilus assembly protein FimV
MSDSLKKDLRNVLEVIDELLDALPEKKIKEFAKSEHFKVYRKLFDDLGLSKPE